MGTINKDRGFEGVFTPGKVQGGGVETPKTLRNLGSFGTGVFSDRLLGGSGWVAGVAWKGSRLDPVLPKIAGLPDSLPFVLSKLLGSFLKYRVFISAGGLTLIIKPSFPVGGAAGAEGGGVSGRRVGFESFMADLIVASGVRNFAENGRMDGLIC